MADSFIKLSASSNGRPIKVTATASPGTLVHTAHATALDIVTLYAINTDADGEDRQVTIEWGGTTAPDDQILTPVPNRAGLVLLADRVPVTGSVEIRIFADETSDINVVGMVIRSGA